MPLNGPSARRPPAGAGGPLHSATQQLGEFAAGAAALPLLILASRLLFAFYAVAAAPSVIADLDMVVDQPWFRWVRLAVGGGWQPCTLSTTHPLGLTQHQPTDPPPTTNHPNPRDARPDLLHPQAAASWPVPKALHVIRRPPPPGPPDPDQALLTAQQEASDAAAAASCRRRHPDWRFHSWGEAEGAALLVERYPWALANYEAYPRAEQRLLALRLFVLHAHGGGASLFWGDGFVVCGGLLPS